MSASTMLCIVILSSYFLKCLAHFSLIPQDQIFSGVYMPNITHNIEPFASCWLITRRRFVNSKKGIETIVNFEGTVFGVFPLPINREIIMTRDYFDFQVEHLSPLSNTLNSHKLDQMLIHRLEGRAEQLKQSVPEFASPPIVVAIIPFNTKGATSSGEEVMKMRIAMFKATFWSIYRYNINIVCSVSSASELLLLKSLQLPLFQVYLTYNIPDDKLWMQPQKSILRAMKDIEFEETWREFKYVFYTDADQILHLRSMDILLSTIESDDFILTPHRLQAMVLPRDVPRELRDPTVFKIDQIISKTRHAVMHVDNGTQTHGSCCDDGRYYMKEKGSVCSYPWYYCAHMHEYTMADWIKFGRYGVTLPLTTEHLGKCRYYPQKRFCDLPVACHNPIPKSQKDSCDEVPKSLGF